ncbi:MAG: hypothetical protein LUC88_02615 [Prevotella sp.]|nr:hypothetical protein [Prevotella sp.]
MKQKILFLTSAILFNMNVSAASFGVFGFFSTDPSFKYSDENVDVLIYDMHLCIYNKTDKVIYLDRALSFAYENGAAICLFSNSAYTEGQTTSSGASVNLGGVANALGIHGAAGSILSGTNVGGGTSNQSSTTYYEQRIVTIAPQSLYSAYTWTTEIQNVLMNKGFINGSSYIDPITKSKTKLKKGESWHYDESTSPLEFKGVINYSMDEDFSNPIQATVSKFVSDLVIGSSSEIDNSPECVPYKNQDFCSFTYGGLYNTAYQKARNKSMNK